MRFRLTACLGAGLLAGALVGLVDGGRAALVTGVDLRAAVLSCLLAAAVDGLVGVVAAAIVALLGHVTVWGRRRVPTPWAAMVALTIAGGFSAAAATAAFTATLGRHNRFLAGGVTALVMSGAAILAMALGPALARIFSVRKRRPAPEPAPTDPAALLLLPFVVIAGAAMALHAASRGRLPASAPATRQLTTQIAFVAAFLPALMLLTERLSLRVRVARAALLAAALYGTALAVLIGRTWSEHLRFLPWTDLLSGAAIAILGVVVAWWFARRPRRPGWRHWLQRRALKLAAAGTGTVLILSALLTSESEPARKATARAGLVGPVLAGARRVIDFDRDGYSPLLGGGDCDDGDASVHPGVLDFPDDGVDQDCDGRDATIAALVPRPLGPVPDTVPRDLNLLLITIDTVRADHLGCYGYGRPTSPALDALAQEGGLFVNGWAHAPSTRYSMPAIATGRWPSAITWDESIWWPRIAPSMRTIAEALKGAGYFTGAYFSFDYFALADHRGFERGVDDYRADRASLHRAVNGPMESRGTSSREMADDAIAFFEQHRGDKFFLWVHFYDPHLSYEPHAEVPPFGSERMDLYDGEIRFTDLHIGRVLARLRELGLWDRTAVLVTGDHGEGFGEHGVTEHGFDLYTAQTKVPLIVRVPGLPPRHIAAPAGHVDIAPTLLNLARGAAEPRFLGRSLLPELAGQGEPAPPPVFQEVTSERGKKRAMVTADWHLIWNWTPENTTECYDLRVDPAARRDLWGRAAATPCVGLKRDLQGMVSALSVPPEAAARLKDSVFGPGATAPQMPVPLAAKLGDLVEIQGAGVSAGEVHPGSDVEAKILFRCLRPVTGGWKFFFHLLGPNGSFRNLDHVPVEGALPVEVWRKGQRILDRLKIPVPPGTPAGDYHIIAGLYRGPERLAVTPLAASDGNKAVRIATFHVQ